MSLNTANSEKIASSRTIGSFDKAVEFPELSVVVIEADAKLRIRRRRPSCEGQIKWQGVSIGVLLTPFSGSAIISWQIPAICSLAA
jgi:hypothetical protein